MSSYFDPAQVAVRAGHFIDGELVTAGPELPVRRPSDGAFHAAIPMGDEDLVDRAVLSAKRAAAIWRKVAPRQRGAVLRRWADLLIENAAELACMEAVVSSRLYTEAIEIDVRNTAEWIRFYGEYCDKIDGAVLPTGENALALVASEPYGVVGAIAPWNFPLVLAIWKIAPAIAAGNAIVLKPSELTPFSIVRVAELGVEAGLPVGLCNIVHGEGPTVGAALVRHPDIACVAFTGSTATGRRIMADAAMSGPKPVSLELGGKGAQLVFADADDLEHVAREVSWGILRNGGQLCYAGSRLVVHQSIKEQLVERVALHMGQLQAGATWEKHATLAPVIHEAQAQRIESIIGATLNEGAQLRAGGHRVQHAGAGIWFTPTILDRVSPEMTGFREEIFGPVLSVQSFDDEEEAYRLADHPTYGLAASVYTSDVKRSIRAARALQAGTVWVNGWGRRPDFSAPFGGWKSSGFGREAGRAGYEKFLRQKTIWFDL